MASKASRALATNAGLRRKNETLEKAVGAVKRAAKNEMAQLATVGALSGGAGAIVGSKLQAYLNEKAVTAGKDADGKYGYSAVLFQDPEVAGSGIPTAVFIGGALAAFGLAKLSGKKRIIVSSLGGGLAAGSYLEGAPE